MSEQTLLKQIAREYYNVIYGAKLNFASLDICEKLPGVISFLSMSLGILGLSFQTFNDKILASALLIAGIVGLMIKPRELNKDKYFLLSFSILLLAIFIISKDLQRFLFV